MISVKRSITTSKPQMQAKTTKKLKKQVTPLINSEADCLDDSDDEVIDIYTESDLEFINDSETD